ncbi:MAG TPA: PQQ-binding-like beta-propeller repeat protein [Solirubrobacteraceae bacterium]|nr:PQQ-binding-like beta-propeller repeat protein [Solirubrobacteraceae bacterium]
MTVLFGRSVARLAVVALALALLAWVPTSARADWTTYRGDQARTGVDTSSVGSLPFAAAWTSPSLGGAIWGQPLVHNGLVVVATESDQVVALSEATGQVVWQASAGTPVPSSQLHCGDISPTVGITSTPVIDPSTNRVFVVADTLTGSTIQHKLFAFNLADGSGVAGFPVDAEPPGDVPADQLQRPGLALAGGQVIIGYGGNDGDCGTYHGWLVSIPEAGGAQHVFEVAPSGSEGAIWSSGNAPPVDSSGNVWTSTGNGGSGTSYGYQESVLKLDPSMNLLDHWAPSTWQSLDSGDVDLGSSAPLLLPGGLVFQIGKQGIGYLLSAASLGGTGATPLNQPPPSVCGGSWGGAVYDAGIIYVTCSTGLRALALNAAAHTFAPVTGWQVTSSVNGPPMVAGGLVWATDWSNGALYGLNPQTGQPVVRQSTPSMAHFATPSASDGKLFLATGQTVEAYTIANPAPAPTPVTVAPAAIAAPKCVLRMRSHRMKIHHPKRPKHHKHAPPAFATAGLIVKCDQAARITLTGTVTRRVPKQGRHGKARTLTVHLTRRHTTVRAGAARTLQLKLTPGLLRALEHRVRETGSFLLTAVGAGGTTHASTRARLRL